MTRLLDRLAWIIWVRSPLSWSRPRWLVQIVMRRVQSAFIDRRFQP